MKPCAWRWAHKSHELRISGEALPGVIQGIELLKVISLSQQVDDPESQATLKRLLRKGPKTKALVLAAAIRRWTCPAR